jgi:hypothetical protein
VRTRLALALAVTGIAAAAAVVQAPAAPVRQAQPWVVNGAVNALVVSGHTLYVGGKFSQVAPRTGPLLALSSGSGARRAALPAVDRGDVDAIVADGRGGWYVAGSFASIGGVACPNLARVTRRFAVDRRFCPRPDDQVSALALDGSTLYAGGFFGRIGGVRRRWLAALDASTGRATSWTPPPPDDAVTGLAIRNGVLYLLGVFGAVAGKSRFSLAAVDIRTRRVTGWDPKAPSDTHGDPSTEAIAATAHAIYVGGAFDHIGGRKVAALAALDPATGRATSWRPSGKPWGVQALTVAGSRLYVGGYTHTGGYLAAYDLPSGRPAAWRPPVPANGVDALAASGSRIYAAADRLRAYAVTTGAPAAWNAPQPNQPAQTLAVAGATVVAGGSFTGAGGVERGSLAALDLRTGRPTSWHPRLSSSLRPQPSVNAIALAGRTVYLGGDFDRVGTKPRHDVAAVTAATGAATSWAPKVTTDQVLAVVLAKPNVVFGGFGAGSSYSTSGKLVWSSPPSGNIDPVIEALTVAGGSLYVGGDFSVVGGANRTALAALDPANGSARSWDPKLAATDGDAEVNAFAVSGSTVFAGGGFDSANGAKRHDLASFDSATGKWTAWAPRSSPVEHVYALAVTPGAVYVGGDGGPAAFDPSTGARLSWQVTLDANQEIPLVHAIAVAGSTVYVGDDGGLVTAPLAR